MNASSLCIIMLAFVTLQLQSQSFSDEFNGTLNTGWEWVREDATRWFVNQSNLTIITQTGALHGIDYNNVRNILLQPAPPTACSVECKVQLEPDSAFHHAGIVYYIDDDHFVRLARGVYDGEQCVWFGWDMDGTYQHFQTNGVAATTVYLRLTANANRYFGGYYSVDRIHWVQVHWAEIPYPDGNKRVGLVAANGDGIGVSRKQIPARFDYFRVDPTVGIEPSEQPQSPDMSFSIFPNPVPQGIQASLSLNAEFETRATVAIADALGREVCVIENKEGVSEDGIQHITLPELKPGYYHVLVRGAHSAHRKLLLAVP